MFRNLQLQSYRDFGFARSIIFDNSLGTSSTSQNTSPENQNFDDGIRKPEITIFGRSQYDSKTPIPFIIIRNAPISADLEIDTEIVIPSYDVVIGKPIDPIKIDFPFNLSNTKIDGFMVSVGVSGAAGVGAGGSFQAVILNTGKDQGIHFYASGEFHAGFGRGVSVMGGPISFPDREAPDINRFTFAGESTGISVGVGPLAFQTVNGYQNPNGFLSTGPKTYSAALLPMPFNTKSFVQPKWGNVNATQYVSWAKWIKSANYHQ